MPQRPQTVFRVPVSGTAIDLRAPPFDRDRERWTHRSDYGDCQAMGHVSREAAVQWIRYESVRDSRHGGCGVLLDAVSFASRAPVEQQGWFLTVTQSRAVWQRSDPLDPGVLEFSAAGWEK
jgi:hypothetical protein